MFFDMAMEHTQYNILSDTFIEQHSFFQKLLMFLKIFFLRNFSIELKQHFIKKNV